MIIEKFSKEVSNKWIYWYRKNSKKNKEIKGKTRGNYR